MLKIETELKFMNTETFKNLNVLMFYRIYLEQLMHHSAAISLQLFLSYHCIFFYCDGAEVCAISFLEKELRGKIICLMLD